MYLELLIYSLHESGRELFALCFSYDRAVAGFTAGLLPGRIIREMTNQCRSYDGEHNLRVQRVWDRQNQIRGNPVAAFRLGELEKAHDYLVKGHRAQSQPGRY